VSNGLEKFNDLENKVYRSIELFKAVKLQKEALEKELFKLKAQMEETRKESERLKTELNEFKTERDQVKEKVEAILRNLESLSLS
jgi:FtsZ-binding cell division protein ZapB